MSHNQSEIACAKKELTQKPGKYQRVSGVMERVFIGISNRVRRMMIAAGEKSNVKRKAALIAKVTLTDAQKKEIRDFFAKHYGKAMPDSWHRLYQSYTGVYRYNYFPEVLLSTALEPLLNP